MAFTPLHPKAFWGHIWMRVCPARAAEQAPDLRLRCLSVRQNLRSQRLMKLYGRCQGPCLGVSGNGVMLKALCEVHKAESSRHDTSEIRCTSEGK